ncbi:hypothetical protein F2M41_17330 [Escherichia coli]|nr:hypothetical protein [Escherichia coli]
MPTNQFMIGDTKQFDASLQTQDGVTLIGYTGTDNEDLFMMLMAASEAKHKDGVVHINARQLQLIIQGLVEKKFPTDRTIKVMNTPGLITVPHYGEEYDWRRNSMNCVVRSDDREMKPMDCSAS